MEERTEVASHKTEIFLVLLLLGHLIVLTYGQPILRAPKSVTGTRNGDVTLQCAYTPMRDYSQVFVKWLVRHGSHPVTIFLRDFSGDHIQQAKYRGRLKVSRKLPGDVSLQLNSLQMDDRSHYICEVTWQSSEGIRIMRDEIIELRVQKHSSNPTIINVEALTTMQSSLEATTAVNSTHDWTTEENGKLKETTVVPVDEKHERTTAGPGNENHKETTVGLVDGKHERTTAGPGNENHKETTVGLVDGKHERTTDGPGNKNNKDTTDGPGRNLKVFLIICIISLCCIVVVTTAYFVFCHRTFQQQHVYELSRVCAKETRNSEETTFTNGYFNDEPDSHALIYDYSDESLTGPGVLDNHTDQL
ncbi:V-set and immunoglobulin domain-containing protein 4 [Arvicola amphibius]|uniref:V-set and immunoglobulin domain-containing protein 4 n=1 Tax=Arvicola amphibius TaxID=1047088 RepID=UPI0018E3E1B8|nr:V-set and immunoglobulin domain-containing protein 4 [Arvicola amphibius]